MNEQSKTQHSSSYQDNRIKDIGNLNEKAAIPVIAIVERLIQGKSFLALLKIVSAYFVLLFPYAVHPNLLHLTCFLMSG